jgi:hypothetical protein
LYYATGARYEGYWLGDQKHGPGCYVFENGEVWAGVFAQDRPLLAPGDTFAPTSTALVMQVRFGMRWAASREPRGEGPVQVGRDGVLPQITNLLMRRFDGG